MDFGDTSKRLWQCFICGVQFKTYFEMKDHITGTHEEGREYVVCPLKRCNAPIRDVKSHFQAKHPTEKLPKIGQMKAMIWKDFKDQRRGKGKTKKPNFKDGYMTSLKNEGKIMHYRSGYEKDVYECLEELNEVFSWDAEPFFVPYYFNGNKHKYFPDLYVKFTDGHVEIWEVKPSNQTHIEKNISKWEACEMYCLNRGWQFKIKTEQEIEKLKIAVRKGY